VKPPKKPVQQRRAPSNAAQSSLSILKRDNTQIRNLSEAPSVIIKLRENNPLLPHKKEIRTINISI
jgi:hypothetical protein